MPKKTETKKVDYNIEYAHIYSNEFFGKEQKESIKELHKAIKRLKKLKKTYVLTVLIDEYNPTEHLLDTEKFLATLEKLNAKPHFLMFESHLARYKDLLLEKMNGKIKKEYKKYIKKHNKVPCSFLIAAWHLKRLGLLKSKNSRLQQLTEKKQFTANKIITILPKKYQGVELKTIEIIESTDFKRQVTNIAHIFF